MSEHHQFSSFFVHDLLFGVEVQKVQEVIHHLEITRVPLASPMVRGLVNLRGQIIAAIDVRRCLELPERPPEQLPIHLIFRTEEGPVSLLVDEIGAVLGLSEDARVFSPGTLKGRLRDLLLKSYKLPNRLLLILDTERLLAELSGGEGDPAGAAYTGPTNGGIQ